MKLRKFVGTGLDKTICSGRDPTSAVGTLGGGQRNTTTQPRTDTWLGGKGDNGEATLKS